MAATIGIIPMITELMVVALMISVGRHVSDHLREYFPV